MRPILLTALAALLAAAPAGAAEISTHVLDLVRGVGRADVAVALLREAPGARWQEVARARTDKDGRVRAFGDPARFPVGTYKLNFTLDAAASPFFPQIDLIFRVTDPAAHYHVPVVLSPYGYSTYRGN